MHLFFDMDDTLIQTQSTYDVINAKTGTLVCSILKEKVGTAEILEFNEHIDVQNSRQYGFLKERFPQSWVQTLRILAVCYDVTIHQEDERRVYDSAYAIYDTILPLYEDTLHSLKEIATFGFPMHLMTAGESSIQEKRILDSNLRRYFDEIHIVLTKNTDIFKEVLGERNPEECVMIGNSLKSDIYPALQLNMHAIHLQRATWAYDQCEIDFQHPRYVAIHTLSEVANVLKNIVHSSEAS